MKRQGLSFAIGGSVSLAVHAAFFVAMPRYTIDVPRADAPVDEPAREMIVTLQPETARDVEPLNKFEMGDERGKGYASHETPDRDEATAPEADADQAFLSLDPAGTGTTGRDPVISRATGEGSSRGQPGGSPPPLVAEVIAPPSARSLTPFGINPILKLPRLVPKTPPEPVLAVQSAASPTDAGDQEIARAVTAPPQPIAPKPPAPVQPQQIAANVPPLPTPAPVPLPATGGAARGGTNQPAADPARMSDSESDPFSRLGTATFRDGRLDIRFGRKVKTRKPRLLLGGEVDLVTLYRASVVLKIDIDATGKVTGVDVVKSSGSNQIDQPTRVAVYEWWFEPRKDRSGTPIADQVQFTIGWR